VTAIIQWLVTDECKPIQAYLVLFHFANISFFDKLKDRGNPASSKSISALFPTACAHFVSLCHILVILAIFRTFSLILYLLWWAVIGDLWFYYCNCSGSLLSNSVACYRENFPERFGKHQYCLILRNCHSHSSLQQPPPWSVSSHQHWGKTLHQEKDYDSLKVQMMISIFCNKLFLIKACTLLLGIMLLHTYWTKV
jgi:hypothetical protein